MLGFHHALVRGARSLHLKKHRLEQRCFLVEGPTAVKAALDAPGIAIERIFVASPGDANPDVRQAAAARNVPVLAVDERTMRALAQTQAPQGIVAVAGFFHRDPSALPEIVARRSPCVVLVLHEVADPGNAGALMRSAEAFGVAAVCCGAGGVDPYNDKVIRASMGSIFHVPLVIHRDWSDLVSGLRGAGLAIVATEAGAADVRSVTLPGNAALVVGNERRGLEGVPPADLTLRVGIPQTARAESLNAAVAGSIALYEIARANASLTTARRTSDA